MRITVALVLIALVILLSYKRETYMDIVWVLRTFRSHKRNCSRG